MSPITTGVIGFVRLSRLSNAVLPALALITGTVATGKAVGIDTLYALVCFVLLHSLVTVWNDIRDEATDKLNGIDRLAVIRRHRGMPILQTCIRIGWLAAIILAAQLSYAVIALLILFVLLGWLYNDKPLQASRRPILSIIILGLSYGLVPFLIGTGLTRLTWQVVVLAIGWTAIRTSLSLLKDYKDAPGDAKAGKKTYLLVYGHSRVARLSFGLAAIGYIACIVGVLYLSNRPVWAAISLAGVAFWLISEHSRLFRLHDYSSLNRLFHDLLIYEILFVGLLVAWLRSL